jgi:hypothetical protein
VVLEVVEQAGGGALLPADDQEVREEVLPLVPLLSCGRLTQAGQRVAALQRNLVRRLLAPLAGALLPIRRLQGFVLVGCGIRRPTVLLRDIRFAFWHDFRLRIVPSVPLGWLILFPRLLLLLLLLLLRHGRACNVCTSLCSFGGGCCSIRTVCSVPFVINRQHQAIFCRQLSIHSSGQPLLAAAINVQLPLLHLRLTLQLAMAPTRPAGQSSTGVRAYCWLAAVEEAVPAANSCCGGLKGERCCNHAPSWPR